MYTFVGDILVILSLSSITIAFLLLGYHLGESSLVENNPITIVPVASQRCIAPVSLLIAICEFLKTKNNSEIENLLQKLLLFLVRYFIYLASSISEGPPIIMIS